MASSDFPQLRRSTVDSESTASSMSSSESIPFYQSPIQRLSMRQAHTAIGSSPSDTRPPLIPEFQNLPKTGDYLEVRVTLAPNPTSFMVSQ